MIRLLSLGAGVQSSTLALMFAHGEIEPMPDAAIFADTGAEPAAVYRWLEELKSVLPYPVHVVQKNGGLTENIMQSLHGGRFAGIPFYTTTPSGRCGMLRRQCTSEFKIGPITKITRHLAGIEPRRRPAEKIVIQHVGISTDEARRMKPARERWIETRWPLIDRRMSRRDCLIWIKSHGFQEPERSACVYCPYHSDAEWRRMKLEDRESWETAVRIDELARNGVRGTKEKLYLHSSLTPLAEVDLSDDTDRGQLTFWDNECTGLCGT